MSSKSFTFRIPDKLRSSLEKLAKDDGRTLSNLIIKILIDYVDSKCKAEK